MDSLTSLDHSALSGRSPISVHKPESTGKQKSQDLPDTDEEQVKSKDTGSLVTDCPVSYEIQGGKPVFRLSSDGQRLGSCRTSDYQKVVSPESSLQGDILAEEISRLGSDLFSLDGLECQNDPIKETLCLDFSHCHGEGCEPAQLAVLLGGESLRDLTEYSRQELYQLYHHPKVLIIDLKSGKARCQLPQDRNSGFDLSVQGTNPVERLNGIYLALMQRVLGEVVFDHQVLERLQRTTDRKEKEELLREVSESDRPHVEDPDRLGFRIQLFERRGELYFSLTDINPEVAHKIWGTADSQGLTLMVAALLAKGGELAEDPHREQYQERMETDGSQRLPLSAHFLRRNYLHTE